MDMGAFAMGCLNYELERDAGKLPEHDIEFQAETGIGPTYNNNEPMTDEEGRFALEEDGRMTPEEIDEYIDSFNMWWLFYKFTRFYLTLSFFISILNKKKRKDKKIMTIYGKTLELNENTNEQLYNLYEMKRETLAFNEGGNKYGYLELLDDTDFFTPEDFTDT